MDCSTPGLPIQHHLPELALTHIHRVSDAIQASHPLSSPSPPAFNLSQHQGLFQWVSFSHQVAKYIPDFPPKSWSITYLRSIHWPYLSPSASFILFLSWAWSLPSFNTESLNFFRVLFLVSLWNYHSTPASALIYSPHIQFLPLSKQLHHVKASKSSLCRNRKGFLIISPSAIPLFFMLFDIAAGFVTSWNVLLSWHLQQWIELNWHSHKRMNEVKLFEIVLKC